VGLPYNPYAPPETPPFAERDPGSAALATRWRRLGGALVDGLFAVAAGFLPAVALHAAGLDPFPLEATRPPSLGWMPSGLLSLSTGLLPDALQWFLIARSGQTLGKKALDMRIVTLDGEVVGFTRGVALRWWPAYALSVASVLIATFLPAASLLRSLLTMVVGADALFIFGSQKRCLHDFIAGTRVVMTREPE
jgi:uncharacterized RDD family membrane protein YckC